MAVVQESCFCILFTPEASLAWYRTHMITANGLKNQPLILSVRARPCKRHLGDDDLRTSISKRLEISSGGHALLS